MVLGLLFGFVFVALAVETKLHVSLFKHKAGRFHLSLYKRHISVFFGCFGFFPSEMVLVASLLLDLILA